MRCYRTGDLTPLHKKIRHLSIYFAWRTGIFERDNYRCRDCRNKRRNLEVHHIKAFKAIKVQYNIQTVEDAIRCDELWDINNGITLCRSCHLQTKNHGARKRKGIHVMSVKQIAA
jgi:5-methylcytosine-specific restriction endonuclease McrA